MVQILMLSKWHVHAVGYARTIAQQPDAKITCVWDDDVDRGQAWAKELGVAFEADLEKALARQDVDAVIVDTPTTHHSAAIIAAAKAGKHIFTEKALAPTVQECQQIAQVVQQNDVKFCISYPNLITSFTQFCKQSIQKGWLGQVHYMRMRTAHDGTLKGWLPSYWYDVEMAGGGAMMDLGCHPMYTAAYLLGKPSRIASVFNTNICPSPAEDNAVSVVEFENKAIAVLETSFISPHQANCFELLGTQGAIIQTGDTIQIRSDHFEQKGWVTPDHDTLPQALDIPLRLWLDGIIHNIPIPFDITQAIALTQLLENAYHSHTQQRIVGIPQLQDAAQ